MIYMTHVSKNYYMLQTRIKNTIAFVDFIYYSSDYTE